ncbi:MAG: hypothetical protein JSV89_03190 [Spirochaetaceae bacterium]|nr:MAG: hypothetical protein JSV89_03190 [Spirochaetaceae bacterium]
MRSPTSKLCRTIAAAIVGLLAAVAAPTQELRNYQSIAVMDFRLAGITVEQMHSVVDRLSLKILGTQGFRRVVGREQREQLLEQAGTVRRHRSYEKNQLQQARIIEVELAVLGEIRKEGDGYRVDLQLVEVDSGDTLYSDEWTYGSIEELLQDADRLATALVRASRQPRVVEPEKEPPGQKSELDTLMGIRLGQEGITAAPGIDGGGYLYYEAMAEFNSTVGFGVKYAVGLFPAYSANHLITILSRLNIRLADELYTGISAAYLLSTNYRNEPHHYLGARLVPIHSGNIGGISIEVLPVSVLFDLASGRPVFMFELLSLAFWLSFD